MKSLLLRIFVSFWLIIGITIGLAALAGYYYAERARAALDSFEFEDSILEASRALDSNGRAGLVDWLENASDRAAVPIYILDAERRDLLGRRIPRPLTRLLHRHRDHLQTHERPVREPGNLRRARPLSQLVGRDGAVYTILFAPPARPTGIASVAPAGALLLLLALTVSGTVSWILARAISNPVRKLRDATVAVASGDLSGRVAPSVGARRDELGMLAQDFDRMAEALQRSAQRQTELSRNISHELRSPLARLRVATELAKRKAGELPELARIDGESERLDRLIGQILSYTRLDSDLQAAARTIDLAGLVQDVAGNVDFECRDEGLDGVRVVTEIRDTPRIEGYADALTSAVENVLRNAARHSPPDGIVRVAVMKDAGDRAVVEVVDDGPGVADDELPQLFEPFFRTRRSAEDSRRPGTGLGLAIARRAVQRNGGTIRAWNREAGGLRVVISLPAA